MTERKGRGRPKADINREQAEKLYALQCTDEEVAAFFNVSRQTIARLKRDLAFRELVERGQAKGRASLRRYLFANAEKGNAACIIFAAKNHLGMKDQTNVHVEGSLEVLEQAIARGRERAAKK